MSAPNAGRQSPEPERQHGKQGADPTSKNPNEQGAGDNPDAGSQLKGLASNPAGALDKAAEEKTSKGTGNASGATS